METKDLRYYFTAVAFNLGKRKSLKQKKSFLDIMASLFQKAGYKCRLQQTKVSATTVQNLIIGDIDKASKVIVGIYDNPSKMLLPLVKADPFDFKKSKATETLNLMLHIVILLAAAAVSVILLTRAAALSRLVRILLFVLNAVVVTLAYTISIGRPSYLNFSRNAGLALIYALADDSEKRKFAYVMCDLSSVSYLGIRKLAEGIPQLKEKPVIILDCLGKGDEFVIGANPKMFYRTKKTAETIQKSYPCTVRECGSETFCALSFFENACMFELGRRDEQGNFYVPDLRTDADSEIDIKKLECLKKALIEI